MPPTNHHSHQRCRPSPEPSAPGSADDAGGTDTIVVSVLTFMLLVVLGGGLGLLAVSLAESPKPATDRGRTMRAPSAELGAPDPVERPTDDPVDDLVEAAGDGPIGTVPEMATDAEVADVPAATPPPRAAPAPRRQPDVGTIPRAFVAVEGRYDAVAVAPLWRRLLSVLAMILIAIVLGVGLAAVAAAVFGALAELLNAAVG